ncbi:hypothetical protein O0L34_g1599 [Tuta absoluta]|nr:hypothetical protein O0L34_g1599 [Tuta absoluta]
MKVGRLTHFDLATGSWSLWTERLDQYFVVNDVKPELKVATLIACIDDATYKLMREFCSPRKPAEYSYQQLVNIVQSHLHPTPPVMMERYSFRRKIQRENENVIQYVTSLRQLSKTCNFKTDEFLRDQFIFGLKSEAMKMMLINEGELSFASAVNKAVALEAAVEYQLRQAKLKVNEPKENKPQDRFRNQNQPRSEKHRHPIVLVNRIQRNEYNHAIKEKLISKISRPSRQRRYTQRFGIDYAVTYNFKDYRNHIVDALASDVD